MKAERTPFAPLQAEIDDQRIEQLAREKGVGTYTPPPARLDESPGRDPVPAETFPDNSVREDEGSPSPQPTPRSRMKKVNLELPDYLWTELKIQAAQDQTSVRHLVMTALRGDGFTIADIDVVEDGRRNR